MIRVTRDPAPLLRGRWPDVAQGGPGVSAAASEIVADVRSRGDAAVAEYTERFDGVRLQPADFEVTRAEIEEAYTRVPAEKVEALRTAANRLRLIEETRLNGLSFESESEGVTIKCTVRPLRRVGCYVPGGRAAYPSTAVMSVLPAKVAGVAEVIVATPPGRDGKVPDLTLVAADLSGADRVFRVGGAQAIAALAYGTSTIPRVEKIVGPGNAYVTAAKLAVSRDVAIDKPAGPTEILVIADASADPRLVALDLVSQAEHGPGGIAGLVTTSEALATAVQAELSGLLPKIQRSGEVSGVLESGGFILVVDSLDDAARFAEEFAPEHVEVQTERPEEVAIKVTSAGLVLLGPYTPVSSTDYVMGVNHVLPTGGYGKVAGGLTVLDYVKPVSTVAATRVGLEKIRKAVAVLSETEGLPNHGAAVEGRFKE
jgi:histidinol dehydrogenase